MYSVEWNKNFENIDLYADISQVTAQDILEKFGYPDVIWASLGCTTFSIAAISHHRFLPMCHNGNSCHVAVPRGSKTGTQGSKESIERSKILKKIV